METGQTRITVYFEDPFWVMAFEREESGGLRVSKVTFGPEPRDCEVYDFLLRSWHTLPFSPPAAGEGRREGTNPKRLQRQAREEVRPAGVGTRAQQAIQLQREQSRQTRRTERRARDEAEEERRFQLRQEKKKAKHRGH